MENGCNECFRCKNFYKFYTKGVKNFNATNYGWCCKRGIIKGLHESCENWVLKSRRRKSKECLKTTLSDLLTEISELKKMVEAELNDGKDL